MMILNSFTVGNDYDFCAMTERPSRFLADKTFKGICLALSRKFLQKEL